MKTLLSKMLGLSRSVLDFYIPILRELVSTGISALLPVALEVVSSLATSSETGSKKREMAVEQLRSSAIKLGINASESLIRLTIESAVQRMKVTQQ